MKNSVFYTLFLAALFALGSCGENYIDEPSTGADDSTTKIDVDSISSHYSYDYRYTGDVVELTDDMARYLNDDRFTCSEFGELYFNSDIPDDLLPAPGRIIVSAPRGTTLPVGYMGRVDSVEKTGSKTIVHTSPVELKEVYRELNLSYRLNAEQLSNSMALVCDVVPDGDVSSKGGRASSGIGSSVNINDISLDAKAFKDGYKIKLSAETGKNPTVTGSAILTIRPMYIDVMTVLDENQEEVTSYDFAMKMTIDGELDIKFKDQLLSKLLEVTFCDKYFLIPVNVCPIPTALRDKLALGFKGSLDIVFDAKSDFTVVGHISHRGYEILSHDFVSNFSWGEGLKWQFPKLEISGELALTNYFACSVVGVPVEPLLTFGASIGGEADLADKDLYAKNPQLTFGVKGSLGVHVIKSFEKWTESKWDFVKVDISQPMFNLPVFPPIDDWEAILHDDYTAAACDYKTSRLCLLFATIPDLEFDIVSSDWLNRHEDQYVFTNVKPKFVSRKLLSSKFHFDLKGLDPDETYYAVPVCRVFDLKYNGHPLPLKNNTVRLGIIGPVLEFGNGFVAFKYNEDGWVSDIDNRIIGSKVHVDFDPMRIREEEWDYDSSDYNSAYAPTGDVTTFTNIKLDETSGVITRCTGHNEETGNVRFSYNENYNLKGMSVGWPSGYVTMSIDWDKDYKITKVTINESDIRTEVVYDYPFNLEENKNARLQQTLLTSMIWPTFGFLRMTGRPSAYLPSRITSTEYSHGEVLTSVYNIKYEFNDNNEVTQEMFRLKEDHDETDWVKCPYGYRSLFVSQEILDYDSFLHTSRADAGQPEITPETARMLRHLTVKSRLFKK